jgi:PIN domain nuclease of toxin-antitoxin system
VTLLDTCVLLWLAAAPSRLSAKAREHLTRRPGQLFVSAISAFEIGVKARRSKLTLPKAPHDWYMETLEFHGLYEIPVEGAIALLSTALPRLHADPCDRILVATAQIHDLEILTPDALIRAYPDVAVVW